MRVRAGDNTQKSCESSAGGSSDASKHPRRADFCYVQKPGSGSDASYSHCSDSEQKSHRNIARHGHAQTSCPSNSFSHAKILRNPFRSGLIRNGLLSVVFAHRIDSARAIFHVNAVPAVRILEQLGAEGGQNHLRLLPPARSATRGGDPALSLAVS